MTQPLGIESARRYVAVIQAPEGYPWPGAPLQTREDAPDPPVVLSVVLAGDYERLEAALRQIADHINDGGDLPDSFELGVRMMARQAAAALGQERER